MQKTKKKVLLMVLPERLFFR